MAGHDWIATAHVPDGVELRLMQRGDEFTILLASNELMSTRASASEEALAVLTHDRLGRRPGSEWLIGGYGMGFTLRAALAALPADATVTVAEIVPEIISWARGPMAAHTAGCLDDPRVLVVDEDVATLICAAHEAYDAVLLDVDNGPEGLTRLANDGLYDRRGLDEAMAALRPGGVLAVWSAHEDEAFAQRLRDTGFRVEQVTQRERADDDEESHVIWFATKG